MTETKQRSIYDRLAKAWGSIKNPDLDSVNPHFGNKYASLKATEDVIRQACAPQGLVYRQLLLKNEEGGRDFHSFIISEDGEVLECSVFPIEVPPNPQSFGSNLTYAKRQQAQADWCIAGEEDDDANAATESFEKKEQPSKDNQKHPNKSPNPKPISEKKSEYINRINELTSIAVEAGITKEGLESYMQATFNTINLTKLTLPELTVLGKHITTLINDINSLQNKESESKNE